MHKVQILRVAAFALVTTQAAAAPPTVKEGIDAWQSRDFTTAVAIWRPLAEKGDADAAFNLGQAYRLGRGIKVDLASAQRWLEKAARAGHLDAQATLGLLLFDSGDRGGAMRWLKSAAEEGEPRALLMYGTALFNGDGVAKDPVLAYAYVSRAAAQGLDPAKSTLAEMDRILPLAQRKKGVAKAIADAEGPSVASAAAAKKPAPPTPAATPAPAASGTWRIQLGAFSQRTSAEALYRKLSGSLEGRKAFYVPAGAVTRLQVGPFPSRAAAASACAALKGQACFPVAAK